MLRDLRFAARGLVRAPGFTAVATFSLALGIMATTAIYSVVHAVILDPFPYRDVDNLMSVRVANTAQRGGRTNYSVDQFVEIAERTTIFDGVVASTISDVVWTGDGEPRRLRGNHGTFNTFEVMGVPALIGRTVRSDDGRSGAEPVVVLGYRFWQREFGADPNVLGRRLRLNNTVRTIVGVMPRRFMWRGADVYLPIPFQRGTIVENVRFVHLLGRLKPGLTAAQAEADLTPIIADLKKREPAQFPDAWRVGLLPFKQTFPSDIAGDIWGLLGAVSLLLMIACANVSNLLLSRAAARQQEMTVRTALGASRTRLVRQLLTENLLLSALAGGLGLLLAYAGLPAVLALVPPNTIPDEADIRINGSVLIFAVLVSAAASLVCGLAPALHTSRRDLASSMREVSRSLAGSSRQALIRKALVVGEVALALVLLSGSGTLVRAFTAMQHVALDVPPDHVLTMRLPLTPQRYPDAARRVAFFADLLPRVSAVPGVAVAALNSGLHPLGNMTVVADVPGEPPMATPVELHQISAGYPGAVGLSVAAGRLLSDGDVSGNRAVALVNERFVRTRLTSASPLGRVVRIPRLKDAPFSAANDTFEIVGVVRDALNDGLIDPVLPEVYVPFTAAGTANLLIVRTRVDADAVRRAVAAQVYAIDAGQPVTAVSTLATILKEDAFATPRFNLVLLSFFAVAGLVLAVVGVYGVMSSAVAQERQEIGIRVALGAREGQIARMVISRGSRLLLLGIAAGLAGSIVVGRLLAQDFWRAAAFDPVAFGAVSTLLLTTGVFACALPAIRAMRVDPIVVLRHD
jgi:predicted permease